MIEIRRIEGPTRLCTCCDKVDAVVTIAYGAEDRTFSLAACTGCCINLVNGVAFMVASAMPTEVKLVTKKPKSKRASTVRAQDR